MINSYTVTSTHKAHVFQLHVHHSLSCVPLRQYRACVVDSLGLGITCVLYQCTMCTRHPNLVSFAFYAIPIFQIICTCKKYKLVGYFDTPTHQPTILYIYRQRAQAVRLGGLAPARILRKCAVSSFHVTPTSPMRFDTTQSKTNYHEV